MANTHLANLVATRVEELVWIFVVKYEHDVGISSISGEVLNTKFKPVFAELMEMHKNIQRLRKLSNIPREEKEQRPIDIDLIKNAEFVGQDEIPHELSEMTDDNVKVDARHAHGNAVPDEFMFFDKKSAMVQRAGPKKPINDDPEQFVTDFVVEEKGTEGRLSEYSDGGVSSQPVSGGLSQVSNVDMPDDLPRAKFSTVPTYISYQEADTLIRHEVLDVWKKGRESASFAALPSVAWNRFVDQADLSAILFTHDPSHVRSLEVQKLGKTNYIAVPLSPGSPYRMAWDLFGAIFVLYDIIRIPMEFLDLPRVASLQVMSWIVRIFWTLDIGMNLITGYIKNNGLGENRLRKVFKRYAYTWLFPDLVLVTFDWTELLIQGDDASETGFIRIAKSGRVLRVRRVLRILRALKLVRMRKVMKLLIDLGFSLTSDKVLVVVDIVKVVLLIIFFTHVIACLWCGLGTWESEYGFQTWLYAADMQSDTIENNYLVSCIWALSLFSGGTDFPLPQNAAERLFNSVMLLICFVAAAGFVSLLTSATTKLLLMTSGPSRNMHQLRAYLAQNRVSLRLAARIQRSAHHIAFGRHGLQGMMPEEDVELLHSISIPLRTELAMEIRGPIMIAHPFFATYNHCCFQGMRQLCAQAAGTRSLVEDDILFMMGERQIEPRMFFVEAGELSYQQQREDLEIVHPGQWAAEAVLWTDWMHPGTLKSMSSCLQDCQVVYVDAKKFQEIVLMFSDVQDAALTYAAEFVEHLNTVDAGALTDLEWDHDRVYNFTLAVAPNPVQMEQKHARKSIMNFLSRSSVASRKSRRA